MVRIRLKRAGKKHAPVYRIIAIDSRRGRDSGELKTLGLYVPKEGKLNLNVTLYQDFIDKGAQPTKSLMNLIKVRSKLSHI